MPTTVMITDAAPGGAERPTAVHVDHRAPASPDRTPLVIIGGMTQTLSSWSGQIRALSARREVLVYEARGQGKTELSLADVSFARHADDLARIVAAAGVRGPVDLCGFSFGGRVALATAALRPALVRRLVVAGVSAGRGVVGRVIVRAWKESLATGDLTALAWLSLADTLGPAYLAKYEAMIPGMIKAAVGRNSYAGISALFEQTLRPEEDDPFAPTRLAAAIRAPTLLVCGALDRLAPAADVEALAGAFPADVPVAWAIAPGVGHTVPIEAPELFRARALEFLDAAAPPRGRLTGEAS